MLNSGFMTVPLVVSEVLRPLRWSHPLTHQSLFAQVLGLLRRLRQCFLLDDLLDDLSTRLGHPDNSLHSSAVM